MSSIHTSTADSRPRAVFDPDLGCYRIGHWPQLAPAMDPVQQLRAALEAEGLPAPTISGDAPVMVSRQDDPAELAELDDPRIGLPRSHYRRTTPLRRPRPIRTPLTPRGWAAAVLAGVIVWTIASTIVIHLWGR
jgi:hypothetical protein